MGLWRKYTLVFTLCALASVRGFAVELNKPNETITEFVVGFDDDDPERAENEALDLAKRRTINGDFENKAIVMDVGDGVFYCRLLIQHKIYLEATQTKNQQVTNGYGSTCERALADAMGKAEDIIAKSCRSISRINDKKDDRAQSLSRANNNRFWLKAVGFEKFGSKWVCSIKFEYIKDKDAD